MFASHNFSNGFQLCSTANLPACFLSPRNKANYYVKEAFLCLSADLNKKIHNIKL